MVLPTTTEEAEIDLRDGSIANSATPFARSNPQTSVEERSVAGLLRPVGDLPAQRRTVSLHHEKRRYSRSQPRLYEREEYLEEIAARISDSWPYSNGAIVIEGSRWTGRTALLGAACRLAAEDHIKVLRARGDDLEGCSPWGIVRQLFGAQPSGSTENAVSLVAASAATLGDSTEEGSSEPLRGRYAHLEAMLDEATSKSLLLIAVDDAHLADAESASWLLHVARRLSRRVRLVVTTAHAQRGAPLNAIDRLRSDPSTRLMTLQPLGRDGTAGLLGTCLKAIPDKALIDEVQNASGGSPFLVVAIGRALCRLLSTDKSGSADKSGSTGRLVSAYKSGSTGRLVSTGTSGSTVSTGTPGTPGRSLDELAGGFAPPEIGRAVLARLAALPADVPSLLALLESIAVLGTSAQLGSCAQLAGLDFAQAATLADCLVDDGLLASGLPLRFEHRTVQASLLQEMGSARRSRIHLAAARLFEQRGEPPETVAQHLLVAEQYGDPWVAHHLGEAGRVALGRGDRASALTFLSQALSQDPQAAGPRLLLDLADASAEVDVGAATRHLHRAMELGADPERGSPGGTGRGSCRP